VLNRHKELHTKACKKSGTCDRLLGNQKYREFNFLKEGFSSHKKADK
jgi:hypothetical protein